jgi:hypothetical protein
MIPYAILHTNSYFKQPVKVSSCMPLAPSVKGFFSYVPSALSPEVDVNAGSTAFSNPSYCCKRCILSRYFSLSNLPCTTCPGKRFCMTDLPSVFRRIYGHSGWWLTLELEVELNATAVPHQRGVGRAGKDRASAPN